MSDDNVKHPLLATFKKRMRIFHNVEDDNLSFILSSSQSALDGLLGMSTLSTKTGKELIIERSRYVYNDCLELFYNAFENEIARIALSNYIPEEEESEN